MQLFRVIRSECRGDDGVWLLISNNLTGIEDPNVSVVYADPISLIKGLKPEDKAAFEIATIRGVFWLPVDRVVHEGFPAPTTRSDYIAAECPF